MTISKNSAAQRARDLLTSDSEAVAGYSIPDIIGMQPTVLEMLAEKIAADPDRCNLLRAIAFSGATVTAGIADLTTNINTDRVLLQSIRTAEIRLNPDTNGFPFQWDQERAHLSLKLPTDPIFIRCAIDGKILYTRDTQGERLTSLGAISIMANFIPVLDSSPAALQLPFPLEGDFVTMLAELAPTFNLAARSRSQSGYRQDAMPNVQN